MDAERKPVHLKTAIPGPRSKELQAVRDQYVARGVSNVAPVFTAATSGASIIDVDGNRYIDFAGGIGVLNVGANHPEVVAAIRAQAEAYLHTCFHVTMHEPYVRLAAELSRITPGRFAKKSVLVNSGAEAVENAVKIARRATGRAAVIALGNSFHGRTLLGMTLTGKVAPYKDGFGPFAPEVYRAPFPYPYRSGLSDPQAAVDAAIAALEHVITVEIGAHNVAAVISEPVQGEGGFIVAPDGYFQRVVELCRKHGVLFIADEIQTGFARTGRMFAMEHWGVEPDLILSAKSLGAGLPLAAVTGRAELMDAVPPGGLGGTYGGNPLACVAALKVIEIMERDDYAARGQRIGRYVQNRFEAMASRIPQIGEVRGLGAMVAMEFVLDHESKTPASALVGKVVQTCYEKGLILMKAGVGNNVIRFLAPLNIADDELEEGLKILESAIEQAAL